jgi:C-terminal processing protease CtpA/Prc
MKNIIVLALVVLFLPACEALFFEPDLGSRDPFANFDYLWEEVDRKYSYFALKDIDWNQIRETYRAQLSASSTEEELFSVLAAMLNELRDDHTNLISPFNISRYNVALRGPANFRQRTLEEFYLPDLWLTGPFAHGFLSNNEVGYVRYGSFSNDFSDEQLDLVLNRYRNTRGLILDLRENGGGSIFIVPRILGRFTQTRRLVGFSITRNGPNHTDFSGRENFFITPYDGDKFLKPVMVLIDRGSYSATTFFALAAKAFPNLTLIGDTTGGGGGLPNGGQLPNGWTYRFSISQLLDTNGNNFAEDGVPPDIEASFNWDDLTKDEIVERAILEITKP